MLERRQERREHFLAVSSRDDLNTQLGFLNFLKILFHHCRSRYTCTSTCVVNTSYRITVFPRNLVKAPFGAATIQGQLLQRSTRTHIHSFNSKPIGMHVKCACTYGNCCRSLTMRRDFLFHHCRYTCTSTCVVYSLYRIMYNLIGGLNIIVHVHICRILQ